MTPKTKKTLMIVGGVAVVLTIAIIAYKPFRYFITTGSFQKDDVEKAKSSTEVTDKTNNEDK